MTSTQLDGGCQHKNPRLTAHCYSLDAFVPENREGTVPRCRGQLCHMCAHARISLQSACTAAMATVGRCGPQISILWLSRDTL